MNAGGRGCAGRRGIKGGKWDNCNSITNKIYFKKEKNTKCEKYLKIFKVKPITQFWNLTWKRSLCVSEQCVVCPPVSLQFSTRCTGCQNWDWSHSHSLPLFCYISKGHQEAKEENAGDSCVETGQPLFHQRRCVSGRDPVSPTDPAVKEIRAGGRVTRHGSLVSLSHTVKVVWVTRVPEVSKGLKFGSWASRLE